MFASCIMRIIPFILLLLSLCGCATFPREMTGQFIGERSDFIVIKEDGSLYWSPPANMSERLTLVGIGAVDRDDPLLVWLTVPSGSPFIYSSMSFSHDYSRATVDWGRFAGAAARGLSREFDRMTPE